MTNKQIQKETKKMMRAVGLSTLKASIEIGIHRNTLQAFLTATEAVEPGTIAKIQNWIIGRQTITTKPVVE